MMSGTVHRTWRALLVPLLLCGSVASGDEPEWVRKRPIIPEYYVGIGMARTFGPAAEYTEGARNVAFNDIASQITVSVSSDVLRTVLENNEQLEQEFQSRIRASASADLEGVQLVDTYESDNEYWVYYRLSRAAYAARRAQKLSAATAQSFDLYTGARQHERERRYAQALGLYAQAFGPIEKYLAEPLVVESEGRSLFLINELYGSLGALLDRIEIRTADREYDATIGLPLKNPLELTAVVKDSVPSPAAGLPFRFVFTRGSGDLVDQARTDEKGIARCSVHKITATDRIQTIEASLDLLALAGGESAPPVLRTVLGSFTLPSVRFVLRVSGVSVFVDAEESMFGEPLQQNRVEPVLKTELGARNFSFVDDRSRASLVMSVRADVRKGAEVSGLAFAFASATVSVLDVETGSEIYKSSINDVKEGSDSYEKAGLKALSSVGRRLAADVVPQLVEKVQR